ncbi:Glycosyltransferase involved in cell wall bisynthesis [Pedococcus cremeus]|uniref:Glycosyltransferase involved in cell wall bisynthesis n=1 Tax=Pedococcus cremeus TaxID=587636 RepID=A0A1H9XAK6_9MICO|nr:glycosyltransferase family 2 protein [Pedococcus cremeus]SES43162.1 Glycosyltransferase involved in cell wall bisynthesis [Pedococcus cremeus]
MGLADRLFRRPQIKMSVVVAVYNTGSYLEPCASSLLGQSLPASEYEVIFVDDGSTDSTPARLDELAAKHPNVTTIHIPNSGWPGKPRNVGIEAAKGEYVYFVDHDDSLAPEALERMYDMASRNHADVVIGKIAGHGRRVPRTLFRQNYEACTLETAPLMESMTPHKGFRREFLNEHHLRFPEGRRRLEDHVFVVEAYLRAQVVSVLSDYTCYHHIARDDAGNAGFGTIEPVGYFGNLREGIDIVERLTEPGPLRDLVMRRWYSVEMLNRVGGKGFAGWRDSYRRRMYEEIRKLALERFTSPGIWEPLGPQHRVRSVLLREGRYDDLVRLAAWDASLVLSARLDDARWKDGRLHLSATLAVETGKGDPALTVSEAGELRYEGPAKDVPEQARVLRPVEEPRVELLLRDRETKVDRPVALTVSAAPGGGSGRQPFRLVAEGAVDPGAVGGKPLSAGVWDLFIRLRDWGAGNNVTRRLGAVRIEGLETELEPAVVGGKPLVVVPYWTEQDNLSLDVGQKTRSLGERLAGRALSATVDRGAETLRVRVELPVHVGPGAAPLGARLCAVDQASGLEVSAPSRIEAAGSVAAIEAELPLLAAGLDLAVEVPAGRFARVNDLGVSAEPGPTA